MKFKIGTKHTKKPQTERTGNIIAIMKSQTFLYCSYYPHVKEATNYLYFTSKDAVIH